MSNVDEKKFPYYINKRYREAVVKLSNIDGNIKDALENKQSYLFTIHADDLRRIYPLSDSKVTRYNPLINQLKEFNIEMRVISKRRNRNIEVINLIKLNKEENNE
jgi:hypothetical protein